MPRWPSSVSAHSSAVQESCLPNVFEVMTPGVGSSDSGEEAAEAHEEAGGADTVGFYMIRYVSLSSFSFSISLTGQLRPTATKLRIVPELVTAALRMEASRCLRSYSTSSLRVAKTF